MVNQRKIKVIKRTEQNLETSSPHEYQKPENVSRDSVRVITTWVRTFRERQRENNAKGFKELFG
jgi:hypothetical protein